ncbi:hypothetical protein [Lysinibacillus sp. NPDC047702]|uniref:hypothetical protein n=1 Tax=unclassified Lysinibacillus TaxID=2636778 RepID=UPI003CFF7A07
MSAEDTINRDSNKIIINDKETILKIDNFNEQNLIIFNDNEKGYKLEKFHDAVINEYFRLFKRHGKSKKVEKYFEYLEQDLLVTLLYESIENINGYFDTLKKHKVYSQLSKEFYFESEESFKKEVESFWGKDKYSNHFESYYKELFNKVPRILFVWYMFSSKKLIEKTKKRGTKINKLIDPRKLPLFNFKNNKTEILNDAKIDINFFMNKLYLNKLNINVSVNLFAFNKFTNLFDLYLFLNKSYKSLNIYYLDEEGIIEEAIYFFESSASVINLSGLKMRKYLIDFDLYNNKYFLIKEGIEREHDLFNNLKNTIKQKIIENTNLEYDIKIPKEIYDDYKVFIELKKIDYYKDLIKTFNLKLFEEGNNIYDQLEAVYNALYSEKKRKKDIYKSMEQVEHMELSAKNKKKKTTLDFKNEQKIR